MSVETPRLKLCQNDSKGCGIFNEHKYCLTVIYIDTF